MLAPDMVLTACVDRMVVPPHGVQGGEDGEGFAVHLLRAGEVQPEPLPGRCNINLGQGDRVVIETSGGGKIELSGPQVSVNSGALEVV